MSPKIQIYFHFFLSSKRLKSDMLVKKVYEVDKANAVLGRIA